jgi:hypothetical protein
MTRSCLCARPTPRPSPRGWVIPPATSLSIVPAGPSGRFTGADFGGGGGFGGPRRLPRGWSPDRVSHEP